MARFSVLIVDDEKNIRHTLRVCLETMETTVVEAASAQAALDAMPGQRSISCSWICASDRRAAST